MKKVDGKVAIVTGGGDGIGRSTCELLAKEGAQVVVTDINVALAKETAKRIEDNGGMAVAMAHDVANEDDWESVMAGTLKRFKKLDILVNNAGTASSTECKDMSFSDWRRVLSVNLDGTFLGVRSAINAMLQNNPTTGSIINISSDAADFGGGSAVSYNASKGGVRSLSRACAIECRDKGYQIRVNSIQPGCIDTKLAHLKNKDGLKQAMVLGEPIDIAKGVLFLASEDSSFVRGIELNINSGFSASMYNHQIYAAIDYEIGDSN